MIISFLIGMEEPQAPVANVAESPVVTENLVVTENPVVAEVPVDPSSTPVTIQGEETLSVDPSFLPEEGMGKVSLPEGGEQVVPHSGLRDAVVDRFSVLRETVFGYLDYLNIFLSTHGAHGIGGGFFKATGDGSSRTEAPILQVLADYNPKRLDPAFVQKFDPNPEPEAFFQEIKQVEPKNLKFSIHDFLDKINHLIHAQDIAPSPAQEVPAPVVPLPTQSEAEVSGQEVSEASATGTEVKEESDEAQAVVRDISSAPESNSFIASLNTQVLEPIQSIIEAYIRVRTSQK